MIVHSLYSEYTVTLFLKIIHLQNKVNIYNLYKVRNNLCPSYVTSLFRDSYTKYDLRNDDYVLPRFNTVTFGKHSLRYWAPKCAPSFQRIESLSKEDGNVNENVTKQ